MSPSLNASLNTSLFRVATAAGRAVFQNTDGEENAGSTSIGTKLTGGLVILPE